MPQLPLAHLYGTPQSLRMATRSMLTSSPSGKSTAQSAGEEADRRHQPVPSAQQSAIVVRLPGPAGTEVGRDVGVVQRLGVREPHLGAGAHEVEAALLQLGRVGVVEHDLVAALAVDLVGGDVEVEELGLVLGEAVLVEQRRVLLAVDRRHLRLEPDDEGGGGDGEVLADRDGVAPALQAAGDGVHVAGSVTRSRVGAARLGEADQQIGVADVGQLLLVHVLEEEVLGVGGVVGRVGVDVAEVVGERADVVVVVLGPAGEVLALQLAVRPGQAERGVLRLAALDRVLERRAEVVLGQAARSS